MLDRLTILGLLSICWLPLAVSILTPDKQLSLMEQRVLERRPELPQDATGLRAFPRDFERYYADHIGLRDAMIRLHAGLRLGLFRASPSERVLVGRDGWLFLGDPVPVDQARGVARFREAELREWLAAIEERRSWLASRGIAYMLLIVPNKHRIQAEKLPWNVPRWSPESHLDQLLPRIPSAPGFAVVDLRVTLETTSERGPFYHRTDTHWNDAGAYAAYREILDAATRLLPDAQLGEPTEVEPGERVRPGDIASLVGLGELLAEEVTELEPLRARSAISADHASFYDPERIERRPYAFEIPGSGLPRAVMFRDSFSRALLPFVSEHFERILYVWSPDFLLGPVVDERPQLVIQQLAERALARAPSRF